MRSPFDERETTHPKKPDDRKPNAPSGRIGLHWQARMAWRPGAFESGRGRAGELNEIAKVQMPFFNAVWRGYI